MLGGALAVVPGVTRAAHVRVHLLPLDHILHVLLLEILESLDAVKHGVLGSGDDHKVRLRVLGARETHVHLARAGGGGGQKGGVCMSDWGWVVAEV